MAITPSQFASVLARNLVPVAGVLFLGWSAPDLLILYSLDTSLAFSGLFFLALIYAVVPGVDPKPRLIVGVTGWIRALAGVIFFGALFAIALSIPMYVLVAPFGWSVKEALADTAFLRGLAAQTAFALMAFVQGYRELGALQPDALKEASPQIKGRMGLVLGRWVFMLVISAIMISFIGAWLPIEAAGRVVGVFILLVYVGITIFIEIAPRRALSLIDSGRRRAESARPGKQGKRSKKKANNAPPVQPRATGVKTYVTVTNSISIPAWLPLVVGAFLMLVAVAGLWQELDLEKSGFRTTGHVLNYQKGSGSGTVVSADLQLDGAGADDAAAPVHISNAFSWHPWAQGLQLNLACRSDAGETHCRIADWRDRWLPPVLEMLIGLGLLAWGLSKRSSRTGKLHA